MEDDLCSKSKFSTADHLRAEGVFKYDEILKKLVKKNNSSTKNIVSKMCPVNFLPQQYLVDEIYVLKNLGTNNFGTEMF